MPDDFTVVEEITGTRWLHKGGRMWISNYGGFFQTYAMADWEKPVPGRQPWTISNYRLRFAPLSKGWPSLEDAMRVIREEFEKGGVK